MHTIIEKILTDTSARSTEMVENIALNSTEFQPWGGIA